MSGGGPRRVHPIRAMRDARGSIRLGPSLVPGLVALVAVDDSEALIDRDARARRAMREARTEAVVVVGIDVALIGGRAVVDRAKGWQIVDLPWWAWLLLAAPALLLMILLLAVPLAELSPGRLRNAGVALLGLLGSPDFQFPQDTIRRSVRSPRLSDYLYVSLTNATAISPTDTMPSTRRAKGLMAMESLISYAVVILVVARAVNVLGAAP